MAAAASSVEGWIDRMRGVLGDGPPPREVVLILNLRLAQAVSELVPLMSGSTIRVLSVQTGPRPDGLPEAVGFSVCLTIAERVSALAGSVRPDLLIESGNYSRGQRRACFRDLFLFLEPGGAYVVDRLSAPPGPRSPDEPAEEVAGLLGRLSAARVGNNPTEAGLADAMADVRFADDVAVVRKRHRHLFKLRDESANELLAARYGSDWGEVIETRAGYSYPSLATAVDYGLEAQPRPTTIDVPPRFLRRYRDVVCESRQRLRLADHFLPDTFRHNRARRLTHHTLRNSSPYLDRDRWVPEAVERLDGSFFHFDSEFPGHFGHVMTEVLSRYWGWAEARRRDPHVRPLVSLVKQQTAIPSFQRTLFEALDIPVDEIAYVQEGDRLEVETLWAATPGFSLPGYADRGLSATWETVARRLSTTLGRPRPERLFVSRRGGWRPCHNQVEVEDFFATLGFTVVYPEDHSLAEQVSLFRSARFLAGFGGSSMFTSMFAPRVPRLLISGETNTANNEYLMASVVGGPLHYFWGSSDIKHPTSGWSVEAFHSGFSFDLERFEGDLRRVVAAG